MMKDLYHSIATPAVSITSAAQTSTATGTGVDLSGYESAVVIFTPATKTDGTHTPTIEESDTSGSGYSTVAAADMIGTLAALTSNTVQKVGYIGNKRYIRAVVTVSGTTTGCVFGATVIRGTARRMPA